MGKKKVLMFGIALMLLFFFVEILNCGIAYEIGGIHRAVPLTFFSKD
jgi:hypothetical protein